MPKIVVIALEMSIVGNNYKKYSKLTANTKIALIKSRINEICKMLSLTEPDAMWIFVWREYGIQENIAPEGKPAILTSISNQTKHFLKKTMQDLTAEFPNLVIISGTVSTQKHFNDSSRLLWIKNYYKDYKNLSDMEKAHKQPQIKFHKGMVKEALGESCRFTLTTMDTQPTLASLKEYLKNTPQPLPIIIKYQNSFYVYGYIDNYTLTQLPNLKSLQDMDFSKMTINVLVNSDLYQNLLKYTHKSTKEANAETRGIDVLRNTAYLFYENEMLRHDKITPFFETKHFPQNPDVVFQPGKGRSKSTLFSIEHSLFEYKPLPIGIEICREHTIGVLKQETEKTQTKPLIHFILSDTCNLSYNNLAGDYVIQLDSFNSPFIIPFQTSLVQVELYKSNLLELKPDLIGPIQPLDIFENRIIREFDLVMVELPEKSAKRECLHMIREEFIESCKSNQFAKYQYQCLRGFLLNKEIRETLFDNEFSLFKPTKPDCKAWVEKILQMVDIEESINPEYKSYIIPDENLKNLLRKK